jgi:putative hydrolase of the HAD superfamily
MMQRHPGLQYIYIADNPAKDFVAPNLLGWKTVQILRPEGQYQSVSAALNGEAQIILTDLREVVRHL